MHMSQHENTDSSRVESTAVTRNYHALMMAHLTGTYNAAANFKMHLIEILILLHGGR
jgi:hypothetical protein